MAKPETITLWYFDVCLSGIGIWTRIWAPSRAELAAERKHLRSINSGVDSKITPDDEVDGSYGQNTRGSTVKVELTPQGLLDFLNRYGDANGE